jgi:hypothetical protein
MATEKTAPKRASTFAPGIGFKLDDPEHGVMNEDVVVAKAWIGERNFDGEMRPIVILTMDDGTIYHAWSASLADKIGEIPESEYPLTFKFIKVPTRKYAAGVITFE